MTPPRCSSAGVPMKYPNGICVTIVKRLLVVALCILLNEGCDFNPFQRTHRRGAERPIKGASLIFPLTVLVVVVSGPDWTKRPKWMQKSGYKALNAMIFNEPRIVQLVPCSRSLRGRTSDQTKSSETAHPSRNISKAQLKVHNLGRKARVRQRQTVLGPQGRPYLKYSIPQCCFRGVRLGYCSYAGAENDASALPIGSASTLPWQLILPAPA